MADNVGVQVGAVPVNIVSSLTDGTSYTVQNREQTTVEVLPKDGASAPTDSDRQNSNKLLPYASVEITPEANQSIWAWTIDGTASRLAIAEA